MARERSNRTGVQDQLRTAIRRAKMLVEGVDRDRLTRRPDEGSWSAVECIDHLNEIARLYLPEFAETIERARLDGMLARSGMAKRTLIGRIVVWTQEPPVRIRMKTFGPIQPARDLDPDAVIEDFETLHEELIVRINEAADLDWKRIRMKSLLDSRLTLCLGDWFHFIAAHARRHLWQAEQALAKLEPAAK